MGVVGIGFIALVLKAKTVLGAQQMLVQILVPLAMVYAINCGLSMGCWGADAVATWWGLGMWSTAR